MLLVTTLLHFRELKRRRSVREHAVVSTLKSERRPCWRSAIVFNPPRFISVTAPRRCQPLRQRPACLRSTPGKAVVSFQARRLVAGVINATRSPRIILASGHMTHGATMDSDGGRELNAPGHTHTHTCEPRASPSVATDASYRYIRLPCVFVCVCVDADRL